MSKATHNPFGPKNQLKFGSRFLVTLKFALTLKKNLKLSNLLLNLEPTFSTDIVTHPFRLNKLLL